MVNVNYIDHVTIGSDPELFIFNNKTKTVVSSIGLIPGHKKDAFVPEGFPEGFGLQTDNILGEFNIPPVVVNSNRPVVALEFLQHINRMKDYIRDFVKIVNPDYDIKCSASEMVPNDQLCSDEATQFGCDPDYNVYTLGQNMAPEGTKTNLRSTGCHIHCGYKNPTLQTSLSLIKVLDLYLGVPSVLIDADTRRRSLYGKAGCFRLTDYGLEYRVLSGYFIKTDELINWMFNQTLQAINYFNTCLEQASSEGNLENFNIDSYLPSQGSILNSINNGNKISAKRLITKYGIELV